MTSPSRIDQAKAGDTDAIAALLSQALAAQNITVVAERQGYCLVLKLAGQPLPDQNVLLPTIRQGIERLRMVSIGVVQIHCSLTGHPDMGWKVEFSLLGALTDDGIAPKTEAPPEQPHAQPSSGAGAVAQSSSAHLQRVDAPIPPPTVEIDRTEAGLEGLAGLLRSRGLEAKARIKGARLQIRLEPESSQNPNRASATLYTLLEQEDLVALGLDQITQVEVYGLASPQKIGWQRLVPMPPPETADDTDVLSFQNRYVSALAFPVLLLLGMVMNALPIVNALLFGVKIWFHEFGHATMAWLAGRRAIPLPIGWTNVGAERSLIVYLGLLTLFGLLFWAGRREGQRWPMVLAVVLMVVQFCFTWLLPEPQFQTLLSFGGIGGELYLCTLLMVSFFFPLPAYWRWDFYRYPVVVGAAFTFWAQIWLWRQINRGVESIPWGSLWSGESHGDMNNLSSAGWSDQLIINTYTRLGNLCLLVLLSVYLYFAIRQNRHYLFALTQRWLARQ
jgi:hypothetical protein